MQGMGLALMGAGRASGPDRAINATQQAISSPLLEEATIEGAKGVLINITGGTDMTLFEVNEASSIIREAADEDANIIFGAVIDESLHDEMKITVIATGFVHDQADTGRLALGASTTGAPPRIIPSGPDALRPSISQRADDLDVPAFIRKKAD
jgi:cell division protein FtsZ